MRKLYAILLSSICALTVHAQFSNLGSSTTVTPNVEYQLTKPNVTTAAGQSGGVWQLTQVNLANPFTLNVQLNFGQFSESNPDVSNPNGLTWATGADGIAFVLAPAPYTGNQGEDIGYATTNQANGSLVDIASFAAEFDTWQNIADRGFTIKGDPVQDHMAFMKRGNSFHPGTANGTGNGVPVILPEIETGAWIPVTISWDPVGGLTVNFNGTVMNAAAADVLAALGGDMTVNWGFTGGTALGSNDQRVRFPAPPVTCTAGRTYTIGGWGAEPKGNNPGTYLHSHFAGAFPSGLTVGNTSGNYNVHFTSAQAITDYLPAGGQSKALTKSYNNPATNDLKNTLVSQLIGVTLAVGMDNTYADFSPSDVTLGNMVINSGTFAGWTVNQFLAAANAALGGAASSYTLDQFNTTATAINENYDGGTTDNGALRCPDNSIQRSKMAPAANATDNAIIESGINVYPNPSRGQVQVNVGSVRNAEIQIVNSRGIIVERRLAGGAQTLSLDLKKYGTGVYVVKMISGTTVKTSKVLVQN